jgi:tetratricopeptide (TPR) repeat protein
MIVSPQYLWLKFKAQALLVFGRQSAALEVFDAMYQTWPQDAYTVGSYAHVLAQAGDKQRSLKFMRELTEISSQNGIAWFNYGFMLEDLAQYEQAEAAFRRATTLNPQLDRAWYGLGLVLIRLRRLDDAIAALEQNTKLQPMSPYGWYQLARVHVDRHETDEATKIIRHLRGFEPKVADQLERETGISASSANLNSA